MSRKLLTIAIPTYNRAKLLNTQLSFLSKNIKGLEDVCEIFISDNCSTDETPNVIDQWKSSFQAGCFNVNCNAENIGAVRNIVHCINTAQTSHVWVMSDDDNMFDGAIAKIINILKQSRDLGLLFLNYSMYDCQKNWRRPQGFDFEDREEKNGKALFEEVFTIEGGWGALTLTTALVYRTDLAQRAIERWEEGVESIMFQLYITAFCALHGSMRITKDIFFEYVQGRNFFLEKRYFIKFHYTDKPGVYLKLMQMGYSPNLCKRNVSWMLTKRAEWLLALKLLIKRPFLTTKCIAAGLPSVFTVLTSNDIPLDRKVAHL